MYSTKEYDNLKISLSAGFTDRRGKRKRQTEETRLLAFISFSESCIFETEVFYEKEQEYPDAEALVRMYNLYNCRPSMYLNMYDRRYYAMQRIWVDFSKEQKDKVKQMGCAVRSIL